MRDPIELQRALRDRYTVLERIGAGGMGEVWRARDPELGRTLALKLLRHADDDTRARFLAEAQLTAQLHHPGVVPIFAIDELPDGTPYFTMEEVHGRTLAALLDDRWPLPRAVEALLRVAETVAYAHDRGVIHRDLKPANVMVGAFGAVLVLDWGLARPSDPDTPDPVLTGRSGFDALATQAGRVAGTPAYMPPEQARQGLAGLTPGADVYALGSILYEILCGKAPYTGSAQQAIASLLAGPPPPLPGSAPAELRDLCGWAMAREPEARPSDASQFAGLLRAWMDGSRRREQALAYVAEADARAARTPALRARAAALLHEARAALATLPTHAPTGVKAPLWSLEEQGQSLEDAAAQEEEGVLRALEAALTYAPELPEAHSRLAALYRARHEAAEAQGDARGAALLSERIRDHDPDGAHAAWLRGDGALTLLTDPPGAGLSLHRFEPRARRLVAEPIGALGLTQLYDVKLSMGSYLLTITAPGRETVRYPVRIPRAGRWDGVPPGASEPWPIWLPPAGALRPDERYVPAGWFTAGDPKARNGYPLTRRWVDAFAIRQFPVTNREMLAFLNSLAARGQAEQARAWAPMETVADSTRAAAPVYGFEGGQFHLRPDAHGDLWDPEWPVVLIDWHAASAFAAWQAEESGLPWRLPDEHEREKATRGVDARRYPWGEFPEHTWACGAGAHDGRPKPSPIQDYPDDESVYGVRGLAGNVRDWCRDLFRPDEPGSTWRVFRGGAWNAALPPSSAADRVGAPPAYRAALLGFRLVRSIGPIRDR